MSALITSFSLLVVAGAVVMLRYGKPRDRDDYITFILVIWGAVSALFSLAQQFTTDTAVYELETGEYLHCTPQGGNHLECEVKHRKDNQ